MKINKCTHVFYESENSCFAQKDVLIKYCFNKNCLIREQVGYVLRMKFQCYNNKSAMFAEQSSNVMGLNSCFENKYVIFLFLFVYSCHFVNCKKIK